MINPEELPNGWGFDRVKDVVRLRNEKTDEKSSINDYLELEDIEQGTGRIISARNTEAVESAVVKFCEGDVLFGKLRPYLEKYWLAEFDGKCTGEILAFKPERIRGDFLKYCVASERFIKKCVSMSYGAKMPRVNWPTQIALLNLPLPPENEQLLITQFLDQTCTAIDQAIQVKHQQLRKLEELRKSIIYKAVTSGLNDAVETAESESELLGCIPHGWRSLKVKNVVLKMGSGVTPKGGASTYLDEGIPLLRSQNIHFDGIRLDDVAFISEETHEEMRGSKVLPKDVLLNITGASIGRVFFAGEDLGEANVNQHVCIIRPSHEIEHRFLAYFLASDLGQKQIFSSFTGASREGLTKKELKNFEVPVPPLEEQIKISNFIETENSKLTKASQTIRDQIETLTSYKKSLIHECVTGKRRITETDIKTA